MPFIVNSVILLANEAPWSISCVEGLRARGFEAAIMTPTAASIAGANDSYTIFVIPVRTSGSEELQLVDQAASTKAGVVVLAGHGLPEVSVEAYRRGAQVCLGKNLDWSALELGIQQAWPQIQSGRNGWNPNFSSSMTTPISD